MSYLDVGRGSEPYDLFVFAINAEQTREKYISRLKKFCRRGARYLQITQCPKMAA